jgi:hypothetical protein
MEEESKYFYGHHYNGGHMQLQKSIGDVKSELLAHNSDIEGRLSNVISSGHSRLADSMTTGHSRLADSMTTGHSSIAREVSNGTCSILSKIGDSECSIIDRMGNYAQDNFKNQSDIASRTTGQLTDLERDIQNRIHETRFLLSKEISDKTGGIQDKLSHKTDWLTARIEKVSDKADGQFADVKNQLRNFETSVYKQFCNLETEGLKNTSKILETLAANKYDALKDEVDAIRADRYADKYGFNFALQNQELSYLKQMINSVEQTQKFGSKTVQFGTGNTAGTALTANQG